jgi:ATP-dependent protease HslVU (ClpYQ) peptidase subunit
MSVVACRILDNGYDIAADSQVTLGQTKTTGQTNTFSKLYESNNLVVGSVGSAEELSLFRLFMETRRPAQASEYALLEFMAEFANWKKERTDKTGIENTYMIGIGGLVFTVQGWHICKIKSYDAIGSGADYALSALYLGHTAENAVLTATELSIYCEQPIIVIEKRNE